MTLPPDSKKASCYDCQTRSRKRRGGLWAHQQVRGGNVKLGMTAPRFLLTLAVASMLWAGNATAQAAIDPQKSSITVRVFKAGVFSAFGHEHEISAPIQQGSFTENPASVELIANARKMRVMDKDISENDRTEIQQTMLGPKVLDSEKFPEIRFRSTGVERVGAGKWIVLGDLTIHGETRPVKVRVESANGRYRGTAELKQKDFGITPVTVAGGTVKVKNELRVEFEIVAR
jgi:polyisoprenoid-binding protein YceI